MITLDDLLPVDDLYAESYASKVAVGREEAARHKLAVVSICRTAMPHLTKTMGLVEELAGGWRGCSWYIYENDSADGTAQALDDFAAVRQWVTVEHATLDREDYRGFEPERTVRLAEYRAKCQEWVRNHAQDAAYVIVLDTDAHGGFSVDGVYNSLGWICEHLISQLCRFEVGAMASHSIFAKLENVDGRMYLGLAAYDAYAARLNDWEDRRMHQWFHALMPPIGSPPIPMNSAFGGLCLYRKDAFLAGAYAGGDCEHVHFHRAMQRAGYQLFLNPGSRYIAVLP